jgi:hypothetical protein
MKISLKTKKVISFFLLTFVFSVPLLAGAQFNPSDGMSGSGLSNTSVYDIVKAVMNWLLLILTILAVIGFIISGLMFIFSGGSEERAGTAKKYLTFSIIGVAVALIGYIAIRLIDTLLQGQTQ